MGVSAEWPELVLLVEDDVAFAQQIQRTLSMVDSIVEDMFDVQTAIVPSS